jgi:hypothetical protein
LELSPAHPRKRHYWLIVWLFHLRKLRARHIPSILFLRHRRRSPHARSTPLPQTKIFGFDELAPAVWDYARYEKQSVEKRATENVKLLCQNEIIRKRAR